MNEFSIINLPNPNDFSTMNLLATLLLLIHLPYLGVVLGSTILSPLFSIIDRYYWPNKTIRRFSRDVMDMCVGNPGVVFVLGVLPPIALSIVYSQIFFEFPVRDYNILNLFTVSGTPALFFGVISFLTAAGVSSAYVYRETFKLREKGWLWIHLMIGLNANGLLFASAFIYTTSTTLFMQPALWDLIRTPVPLLFDWNAIARFGLLSHALLITFGLWIVFYRWRWRTPPDGEVRDEAYENFIRYLGAGLSLALLVPMPIFILWVLGTLPLPAYTILYFAVMVGAVAVMMVCATSILKILISANRHSMPMAFIAFLIVMLFLVVSDQLGRESANRAHHAKLTDEAEEARIEMESEWEVDISIDLAVGEQTFKAICSTCHAFDKKIVGPPYKEVLPKYVGDFKTLMNFIGRPYKIDPAYQAMPRQPINKKQTVSVAAWIMKEAGLEYPETMEEVEGNTATAKTEGEEGAAAGGGEAFSIVVYDEDGEVPPGNSLYYTNKWQDVSSLEGAVTVPVGVEGTRPIIGPGVTGVLNAPVESNESTHEETSHSEGTHE